MEEGIFTRDRAEEIIRISVAMANKYVLHKEVDFRSSEELGKVQQTILKLIGVGLEIKAAGDVEKGIRILMEESPVDLFRVAHTRIDRLRARWNLLLQDHRIEILVSADEYECLDDLTCQRLATMSIFTDAEIESIRSNTLDDVLFATLAIVQYYESELERYEFILRLREILPFELLNKSPSVRGENLAEVDSVRDALITTFIISGYADSEDPVAVSLADVRTFLTALDLTDTAEVFPEEVENVVLDVIHELGKGLEESEAAMLTREVLRVAQGLMETIITEWDTVNSPSETTFFKRWSRLAILSDVPDPVSRIIAGSDRIDEFDFEVLAEQLSIRPESEARDLARRLPWERLSPDQTIRLFEELHELQTAFAESVSLKGFSAAEFVDLVETLTAEAFGMLLSALEEAATKASFTLEDLEMLGVLPHAGIPALLRKTGRPAELESRQILHEFMDGSERLRGILLLACWGTELVPELVKEGWHVAPEWLTRFVNSLPASDVGPFLEDSSGGRAPRIVKSAGKKNGPGLRFDAAEINALLESLSEKARRAALSYFAPAVDSAVQVKQRG
jgi:hypothetical protein